jgi:prolyl-tRNA synthetase
MAVNQGVEIGHVFKLGTKYSAAMGATFSDDKGQTQQVIMGCYGIGVNRILAAAVESGHDANGIIWPLTLAPYEVVVVPLQVANETVVEVAESLAKTLTEAGVEVLIDDRDQRPGVKFKDADLIGIPLRIVIGERGLKEGTVEVKWRTDAQAHQVSAATAAEAILAELDATRKALEGRVAERQVARAVQRNK